MQCLYLLLATLDKDRVFKTLKNSFHVLDAIFKVRLHAALENANSIFQ